MLLILFFLCVWNCAERNTMHIQLHLYECLMTCYLNLFVCRVMYGYSPRLFPRFFFSQLLKDSKIFEPEVLGIFHKRFYSCKLFTNVSGSSKKPNNLCGSFPYSHGPTGSFNLFLDDIWQTWLLLIVLYWVLENKTKQNQTKQNKTKQNKTQNNNNKQTNEPKREKMPHKNYTFFLRVYLRRKSLIFMFLF